MQQCALSNEPLFNNNHPSLSNSMAIYVSLSSSIICILIPLCCFVHRIFNDALVFYSYLSFSCLKSLRMPYTSLFQAFSQFVRLVWARKVRYTNSISLFVFGRVFFSFHSNRTWFIHVSDFSRLHILNKHKSSLQKTEVFNEKTRVERNYFSF